jgi:rhodanese-related sulfurtransferase/rubrerythrin
MDDYKLKELLPDELRRYMADQDERRYILVDVRQKAEYAAVHIPGAVLIPLMELESRLFDLPADRELVFYCRTGARSQVAAMLAAEAELSNHPIYNLVGGILAWKGGRISDFPRIQVFQAHDPDSDAMLKAMDLEKGAFRYYRQILETYAHEPFTEAVRELSLAEEGHARLLYTFWRKAQTAPPDFESLFQDLGGEILESGEKLQDALDRLPRTAPDRCLAILELSLEIEYRAYDLYRNMAEREPDPERRQGFLSIAQAEKKHMQILSRTLDVCTP